MKKLTIAVWFLCCVAIAMLLTAAAPTVYMPWTAPRGTGGILVSTNRAAGTLTLDGSALSPQWTNVAGVLRPISTNQTYIYPSGAVIVGSNTVPILGVPGVNDVLVSSSESSIDGAPGRAIQLDANNATLGTFSGILLAALDSGAPSIEFYHHAATSALIAPGNNDLTTPLYYLNSFWRFSTGTLFAVANSNVVQLAVGATNGISTPEITAYGGTSHPWQFGSVVVGATVALVTTNYVEVSINGVLRKLALVQ